MKETIKVLIGDVSSPTLSVQSDLGNHGSLLNLSFTQTVLPSLLKLSGDIESNPGPETQLTVKDHHFKVVQCLKTLNSADLMLLGGALGLYYTPTLDKIRTMSSPFSGELVLAWLNQQDDVMKVSGKPTWESLIKALRNIGHKGVAQQIAQDQMKNQYQESTASTVSSCSTSEISIEDFIPYFPFLPTDGVSEDETRIKMNQLLQETEQIKNGFVRLFHGLQKSIQKSHTLNDLLCLLNLHGMNFEEELLEGCDTLTEAFRRVFRFSSFYDYHITKLWIKKFGGKKNKEALKNFRQEIQKYSKRQVHECPSNAFGKVEKSEEVLSLESEIKFDKMTIKELRKLEIKMKRALGGPVLRLLHIDEGYKLKYRTLSNSIIDAITDNQKYVLQSLGFVSISYGDHSIKLSSQVKSMESNDKGKDPTSSVLSLVGEMAADDANSTFDTISDITGTGIATPSDGGGSILTSLSTSYTQDYRDLKDPRLDIIVEAETTKQNLELHHAAEIGDLEEVKHLITKGLNPLIKNMKKNTVLHIAAQHGRLEVLTFLTEDLPCNPTSLGQYGMTPLHQAARAGHLSIVKYLVDKHQVDPFEQDEYDASPLHRACEGGNLDIVKYLMEKMLAYMTMKDIFNDYTKNRTSPIHIAAQFGHIDILKYFIRNCNCDPNLSGGDDGGGSLFIAAQRGHLSIVKFLIKCGCDPESRNDNHSTPLHLAAQCGRLSIVKYLCEDMKCDPLYRNKRNNTPIHLAALRGRSHVIDYFINIMQCDPNVPGQYGRKLLHSASQEGHLPLIKNLIEYHACNPNSLDDRNSSALHIAAGKGHLSTIRYLIEVRGCSTMLQDEFYGTPLHTAAGFGRLTTIKYFIEHLDCSPSIRNMFNKTPLQLAQEKGHRKVVDYLCNKQ